MKVKASMRKRTKIGLQVVRRKGTLYTIVKDDAPVGKRAKSRQPKPKRKMKPRKY